MAAILETRHGKQVSFTTASYTIHTAAAHKGCGGIALVTPKKRCRNAYVHKTTPTTMYTTLQIDRSQVFVAAGQAPHVATTPNTKDARWTDFMSDIVTFDNAPYPVITLVDANTDPRDAHHARAGHRDSARHLAHFTEVHNLNDARCNATETHGPRLTWINPSGIMARQLDYMLASPDIVCTAFTTFDSAPVIHNLHDHLPIAASCTIQSSDGSHDPESYLTRPRLNSAALYDRDFIERLADHIDNIQTPT